MLYCKWSLIRLTLHKRYREKGEQQIKYLVKSTSVANEGL